MRAVRRGFIPGISRYLENVGDNKKREEQFTDS